MAVLTGDFPCGDCKNVRVTEKGIECGEYPEKNPYRDDAGFGFRARLTGDPGERVTITLHAPKYDPRLAGRDRTYWFVHSFAEVAAEAFFMSEDEINWNRIENVTKDDWSFTFSVEVPAGGSLELSLRLPYTGKALRQLCEEFAAYLVPLCKTELGEDVPMFRFGSGKNVIWLQANQHVSEVYGTHSLTALMRRLTENGVDLKDYSFFVIPSVAVDLMLNGTPRIEHEENINRNWGHPTQPETIAITELHKKLAAEGYRLLVMTDMHNGWCRAGDSGGNYVEYNRGFISDEYWFRRIRFSNALLGSLDYERPDKLWWHDYAEIRTFCSYGSQVYGSLCSTMEYSYYELWDRALGCYVPVTQERLWRIGRELADFLLSYEFDTDYEQGEQI